MTPSSEYFAGFFDGDGSMGIYYGGKGAVRMCIATNTYLPVLELYMDKYGGRINDKLPIRGQRKKCYQWTIGAKAAIRTFLEDIEPHLVEKKIQAQVMLGEVNGLIFTDDAAAVLRELKKCN